MTIAADIPKFIMSLELVECCSLIVIPDLYCVHDHAETFLNLHLLITFVQTIIVMIALI